MPPLAGLGQVGAGAEDPALELRDEHDDGPPVGLGFLAAAANSSVTSWRDSALRLCGESRVIVATRSATA